MYRPGADNKRPCVSLDVTTRAELKAAVDACVGDRLCELTMPHWDVSRVTDMSFLFEGNQSDGTSASLTCTSGIPFDHDIRWEMSQVTDARGMFQGASRRLLPEHHRLDLPTTRTRRGCSRARTPGSQGGGGRVRRRSARRHTSERTSGRAAGRLGLQYVPRSRASSSSEYVHAAHTAGPTPRETTLRRATQDARFPTAPR